MESRDKILEEVRREVEYYKPHTRSQYFKHVRDYLDYVGSGDWRDRDTLYAYAKKLRARHSQEHVNYIVRGPIGSLFRAYNLPIPIKLPRVQVSGVIHDLTQAVMFDREEIEALIAAARRLADPVYTAAFAIATTYLTRVSEIATIEPKDVHPNKKTLVIHTAKHGYLREHVVPPQVAPYIFGFNYPYRSIPHLYKVFSDVREEAGLAPVAKKNYHAIRHGVATEMIYGPSKIRADDVYMFMRWKGAGMLATYSPFHPDNDNEIFEKHPFLEAWT